MKLAFLVRAAVLLLTWFLLTLGAGLILDRISRRSWEDSLEFAEQQRVVLEGYYDVRRPPLWGLAQEGTALQEYRRAVQLMFGDDPTPHQVKDCLDLLSGSAWRGTGSDAGRVYKEAKALVGQAEARLALAALRRGTHCESVGSLDEWMVISDLTLFAQCLTALAYMTEFRGDLAMVQGERLDSGRWALDRARIGLDLLLAPSVTEQRFGLEILESIVSDGGHGSWSPDLASSDDGDEWRMALPILMGEVGALRPHWRGAYLWHLRWAQELRSMTSGFYLKAIVVRSGTASSVKRGRMLLPTIDASVAGSLAGSLPPIRGDLGGIRPWFIRVFQAAEWMAAAKKTVLDDYRALEAALSSPATRLPASGPPVK